MRNRETAYRWLNSFTDFHNVSDKDTAVKESAMFQLTKTHSDKHTAHKATMTKMDVYLLLQRFFKNDCQVPVELCVAIDNLFMTVGIWLAEYVIETSMYDTTLNNENPQWFFNVYSKQTIPWYLRCGIVAA